MTAVQLHAVVGRGRLPAIQLLDVPSEAQQHTPAARPRIPFACTVGENFYELR